jgi:predicted outer membrane repeat protein
VFLLATVCQAATIHVPGEEPTIQAGIDAASHGDTVLVACGTYYEHDIEMKSGVCLTSETGDADCVTIDALGQGKVLLCYGVASTTTIRGFTISGGQASMTERDSGGGIDCRSSAVPAVTSCVFFGNAGYLGGGVHCNASSPTIDGCLFSGNSAESEGGGLFCGSGSSPTITDAVFTQNDALSGGGILIDNSTATLTNVVFSDNSAYIGGGLMCSEWSSPTLTNVEFYDNEAYLAGGGIMCSYGSSPVITDATFAGNSAMMFFGGAIGCQITTSPLVVNATFVDNSAMAGGSVASSDGSSPTLENCVIAFGTQGAAVMCDGDSDATLTCCDVYGNAGGNWVDCIADQYGVNGNFSEDPLFCYDDSPDQPYSLHEGSPCLPENSPCGELVGVFGEGCGPISPVESTSWGAIKAMYR